MRSRAHLKSHPIHPMLVAFPIGLWTAGFLFDVLGVWLDRRQLWIAGYYCMLGGIIGAVLAAVPGVIDLFSVVPPHSSGRKRGYVHGLLNVTALVVFAVAFFRRESASIVPDGTALLLGLAGVVIIAVSGWLGGTLVYRNQIGVDHRYANAGKWNERTLDSWERPVCNQSELGDGQMMLANVRGQRIAVGRCDEGMQAFDHRCTHKGGPLADGVLIGCTVQCPWHGSQFDVTTGRVVAGPAKRKISTHKLEVRKGEVYLLEPLEEKELERPKNPGSESGNEAA